MKHATRSVKELPIVPAGWWDNNIPADAGAAECLALVEELYPDHPALPDLRWIAKQAERSKAYERQYRCPACRDVGQVETKRPKDGLPGWQRCVGPRKMGCPFDAHEVGRKKRATDNEPQKKRTLTP